MSVTAHEIVGGTITVGGYALKVERSSVTLDETWSPYCQAEFTCTMPSEAIVAALEPRTSILRATFSLRDIDNPRVNFPVVRDRPFNLHVRRVVADRDTGVLELSLASDEALLQDFAYPFDQGIWKTGYTSLLQFLGTGMSYVTDQRVVAGTADATVSADATWFIPGRSLWDAFLPLVLSAGMRLYCDEQRVWRLAIDGALKDGALQLTYLGTVKSNRNTRDRDSDYADSVIITYRYSNASGQEVVQYDSARAATVTRTKAIEYPTGKPGPGVAARVLARAQQLGRSAVIEAVSDNRATPSQSATLTEAPGAPVLTGVVASVTWKTPEDTMTVATRGLIVIPDRSWLSVPTGRKWTDVASGTTWQNYSN